MSAAVLVRGVGQRSREFGCANFSGCDVHEREAAATHDVLERLARRQLSGLDPDAQLLDVLEWAADPRGLPEAPDSLDLVELLMALEEEFGTDLVPGESELSMATWRLAVRNALLGVAAASSSWGADHIWARSVRGIVNERVRWAQAECTCALATGRRTSG